MSWSFEEAVEDKMWRAREKGFWRQRCVRRNMESRVSWFVY
jgi:hypothetical protein